MRRCGQPDCLCWQWLSESREDIAKRVADSYRSALHRVARGWSDDPAGDLHRLDYYWKDHDLHWPASSRQPIDTDAWLPAADIVVHVAHLVQISAKDVRQWAYRGRIRVEHRGDGTPIYNVGDLIAYQTRRRKHAG